MSRLVLRSRSPDQPGIIARYSALLYDQGANILKMEQSVEAATGLCVLRIEADLSGCRLSPSVLQGRIRTLAESLDAELVFE